ncbi:isochorismate synthase [Tenacibaculum adriaticum]|uniref:isochorismate synthase n=1 Tax=Tenacibaculum adriaticum TaxID=413713 RepID=A0A5S5DTW0_9FLAO|nr:isochorismate synthase [Tenacibaculum adriaticum]TYP98292.1 isochorismate synthase [Tenacibaculum adriaticum]
MKIFKRIKTSVEEKLPCVAYRKPNEMVISAFFQKDNKLHTTENYVESGFVFAPFNDEDSSILIPTDFSEFIKEEINFEINLKQKKIFPSDEVSRDFHIKLVKKGVAAIKDNQFVKVVLSRKEVVDLENFDAIKTFQKLLKTYNNAFVYMWFHPKVGLWLGATPETLVKINEQFFETMSLAGTQEYKGDENVTWQPKEIDEQQVVTDYVLEKLKPICKSVSASEVETVKAGNLLHLKTGISGRFEGNPSKLITMLHPTPAVCGFPKEIAKTFIIENEGYNRGFYTGFLGELNLFNSQLFVNLRCMEIKNNSANIYVGGGITKESNPQKEWEETVVKAQTMKIVL